MNISTNENIQRQGGAFADGLTLVRVAMVPIIMLVIIKGGWPSIDIALIASILFAVAAVTDILDDLMARGDAAIHRQLGWFDDIADTVLITGTLAAMLWSVHTSGHLTWLFAVPAGTIIIRDILVDLIKGGSFRKTGWPETRFGTLKTFISMLAICVLVAAPWLSNWIGRVTSDSEELTGVYSEPLVGQIGLGLLWVAAIFSVLTGLILLLGKTKAANDA